MTYKSRIKEIRQLLEDHALARRLTVLNKYGVYSRPALLIVKATMKHREDTTVSFRCEERIASGFRMLGLLTLEAMQGRDVIVEAEGSHAREVIEDITACVNQCFNSGEPCLPVPASHSEWIKPHRDVDISDQDEG